MTLEELKDWLETEVRGHDQRDCSCNWLDLAPEILALVEAANKWEQVGDGCHWEELDLLNAVRAFNAKLAAL